MDTAIRSKYRYHQHRHVHFQGGHSSSSQSELDEEEAEREAEPDMKKLDTTQSDDSYSIDLPRRRPHMAYLKMNRNMNIALDSVEKVATNVTQLMNVVKIL